MGLLASETSGSGDFNPVPEGIYTARAYRIVDLGTQLIKSVLFGESEKHQVMISWELIGKDDARMDDGRPYSMHKTYTVSLHEKSKLRADLEAWRGKKFTTEELAGFDLGKILGQYCTIQVVHSEDGKYANVQTIMAHKGDKPEPVNTDLVFDIDKPDMQIFETFSDNLKSKIMNTPEWAALQNPPKPTINKAPRLAGTDNADGSKRKGGEDLSIEDLGEEPINLSDIPF